MRKMRKLNKSLVEKIVNNTWYTTRKYEYFYDNLIIKRIEICDLDTTAVYDESRYDLYDMYGNPIDINDFNYIGDYKITHIQALTGILELTIENP